MKLIIVLLSTLLWSLKPASCSLEADDSFVTIAMLVRNKAFALPYTLAGVERFNYNASRLSLLFFVDHTIDNSLTVLRTWQRANLNKYARIQIRSVEPPVEYPGEDSQTLDWISERFIQVLKLRQLGLDLARNFASKFVFYLDADVLITNPDTLRHLTSRNVSLIAPLLNCSSDPSFGANFWGDIDSETGYYARSATYMDIQKRNRVGLFPVAVIHSAFLLSLSTDATSQFQFFPIPEDYPRHWPIDDLPVMSWAAAKTGIQPVLDNSMHFGVYSNIEDRRLINSNQNISVIDLEAGAFKHALLEFHYHQAGSFAWQPADSLAEFARPPTPRRFGFDLVFVINLARRPDRLERMRYALTLLGIDWQHLAAVDGRQLNASWLQSKGIQSLTGYADPYHGRGLTMGEVGCFLSHHAIWQALANDPGLNRVLVLEDDVRFYPNFEERLQLAKAEADRLRSNWELLYLGRKIMYPDEEVKLPGAEFLASPGYTYWTLGYAITKSGARKLIDQQPLNRLIAVDEYLPVMFDRHPNDKWKSAFQPRNLIALSTAPLLLQPNYYIGMQHYVSDTEGSELIGGERVCRDKGANCSADGDGVKAVEKEIIRN